MKTYRRELRKRLELPLLVVAALLFSAGQAAADRTVKLSVSVIDDQDKDIAKATVIVTGEGTTPVTVETDDKGNAVATVTLPPARFGEGWLRSAPVLTVVATKNSVSSQNTITVRSKDFKDGSNASMNCTVVLRPPPPPATVQLTVRVKDEAGHEVSGARINVHRSKGQLSLFRKGIVVPPDYQEYTNAQGIGRVTVTVAAGESLDLAIEVAREDMESRKQDVTRSLPLPGEVPVDFVLNKRSAAGAGPLISVIMEVQDSQGNALEGAAVLIRDASLGLATGRFTGVTGSDGKTTIPVMYASADQQENLPAEATKPGYKKSGISVALAEKQVGKTVVGGTIKLEKAVSGGTRVTVTVRDKVTGQGVSGAEVILDGAGYYSDNTNSSGEVSFEVAESGAFAVRISQDTYRPGNGELRLSKNDKEKTVPFELEPKQTKDEGQDVIDVTVLWKDTTDEKMAPAPLAGAYVKGGSIAAATDSSGKAALHGAFEEKQEVSADAPGYKSQRKTVSVHHPTRFSAGKGAATFILEPELSENSPIHFIIEVVDGAGAKIEDAGVDFYSASGALIWGLSTKKGGVVDFRSSDVPSVSIAELRKGISVDVKKKGEYKDVLNRSVPSNLLQPSLEAGRYRIEMERDWTELEKAIIALEERIAGWKKEAQKIAAKVQAIEEFVTNCAAARKRTESILKDLKRARAEADKKLSADACKEAKELDKSLERLKEDAVEAEHELKSELDEAIKLAATCKSKEEAQRIRSKQRHAISLAGELGKMEKEARSQIEKLAKVMQGQTPDPDAIAKFQESIDKIELEISSAGKDAAEADNDFTTMEKLAPSLPGRRAELVAALDQLRTKYHVRDNEALLPRDLRKRLDNFEAALRSGGNNMSLSFVPTLDRTKLNSIKDTVSRLQESKNEAVAIAKEYEKSGCDVRQTDFVARVIGEIVFGAMIELGAAGDLKDKADACDGAGAAASPSPTANDQVTVPDVSGFNEVGAMKAAAGPDLVGVIVATKATPPPGTLKLFAYQDPPAGAKAKRGSALKIFIYQSLAMPSPTPTPSPAADEVIVPDISAVGGNDIQAMKAAAGPDLVAVVAATKATPVPAATTLFAGQDPAAGSKAKRGSTLKIFVYQSLAQPSVTPSPSVSPTPTPAASPTSTPTTTGMPNLIGLTLDQAVSRLPSNMRIGSTEMVVKPPTPDKALTVYAQTPAAGTKVDARREIVVSVKIYGESATSGPSNSSDPFVGTWTGDTIYYVKEITISKGEGGYEILAKGKTSPYPANSDGTRLSHEFGIYKISYTRVGDTLEGDWSYTDLKGRVTTGKSILKRK